MLTLALVAVFSQNFVAQTHIHCQDSIQSEQASKACHDTAPFKRSSGTNPADCFLCHLAAQGAAAPIFSIAFIVAPATDAIRLPLSSFTRLAPAAVVSYNWQGRGPPSI